MIPIGSIVKLELLEEEGIEVGKKNGGKWLSMESSLRRLLWRLISLKPVVGNEGSKHQCEL
ncbi:unnamed protein product [Linum tenue]|uniref:Uncharacterized protein n=1 Tax=Linum tenue TaxID=586396 RepID=A0AAV0Q1N2_9ROSI|nr:unnamed protein product [Linum tenue]